LSIALLKEGRKECSNCKWDPTKPIWVPFLRQQQHSSSKTSPQEEEEEEEEEEEGIRKKQEMDSRLFFFLTTTSLNPKFFIPRLPPLVLELTTFSPPPQFLFILFFPRKKGKQKETPKNTRTKYIPA
jgi:hypothetical protein